MEENYSRGKRFGDKFWKCLTLDVLSIVFCFGKFCSSRRARAERVSFSKRCWVLSQVGLDWFDPMARILSWHFIF